MSIPRELGHLAVPSFFLSNGKTRCPSYFRTRDLSAPIPTLCRSATLALGVTGYSSNREGTWNSILHIGDYPTCTDFNMCVSHRSTVIKIQPVAQNIHSNLDIPTKFAMSGTYGGTVEVWLYVHWNSLCNARSVIYAGGHSFMRWIKGIYALSQLH